MKRTMIKKELRDGRPCDKCIQAEELLKKRGLWQHIDEVVWAKESDPQSEGFQLAAKHGVDVAPFFIVSQDDGTEVVYTSALRFLREQFPDAPTQTEIESTHSTPEGRASMTAASHQAPSETSQEAQGSGMSAHSLRWNDATIEQTAREYAGRLPQEILHWGLETFGEHCAIAFSGAEDVVLIDMAVRSGLKFSVFCLDTGRLHPETYQFLDKVREHYGISIHLMAPETQALQNFVREKGLFSFYKDGHKECCGVRKVEPLRRALKMFDAWITGQRRDQSPATRDAIDVIAKDPGFQGRQGTLIKLNPLANWSSQRVWEYIRAYEVPYNPLHSRGFISIGCEPCTRATLPGEHERAGRWWWEEDTKRECGLHVASDT